MNSEESTLKTISPEQQIILNILLDIQSRITLMEIEMISIKTDIHEIKKTLESLDKRVLATEIRIDNFTSLGHKAISIASDALSVLHGLRGEMRALRAESAFRNQEFERLEKLVS